MLRTSSDRQQLIEGIADIIYLLKKTLAESVVESYSFRIFFPITHAEG